MLIDLTERDIDKRVIQFFKDFDRYISGGLKSYTTFLYYPKYINEKILIKDVPSGTHIYFHPRNLTSNVLRSRDEESGLVYLNAVKPPRSLMLENVIDRGYITDAGAPSGSRYISMGFAKLNRSKPAKFIIFINICPVESDIAKFLLHIVSAFCSVALIHSEEILSDNKLKFARSVQRSTRSIERNISNDAKQKIDGLNRQMQHEMDRYQTALGLSYQIPKSLGNGFLDAVDGIICQQDGLSIDTKDEIIVRTRPMVMTFRGGQLPIGKFRFNTPLDPSKGYPHMRIKSDWMYDAPHPNATPEGYICLGGDIAHKMAQSYSKYDYASIISTMVEGLSSYNPRDTLRGIEAVIQSSPLRLDVGTEFATGVKDPSRNDIARVLNRELEQAGILLDELENQQLTNTEEENDTDNI